MVPGVVACGDLWHSFLGSGAIRDAESVPIAKSAGRVQSRLPLTQHHRTPHTPRSPRPRKPPRSSSFSTCCRFDFRSRRRAPLNRGRYREQLGPANPRQNRIASTSPFAHNGTDGPGNADRRPRREAFFILHSLRQAGFVPHSRSSASASRTETTGRRPFCRRAIRRFGRYRRRLRPLAPRQTPRRRLLCKCQTGSRGAFRQDCEFCYQGPPDKGRASTCKKQLCRQACLPGVLSSKIFSLSTPNLTKLTSYLCREWSRRPR